MKLSFNNKILRDRGWEGDVLYIPGGKPPVLGKLYLSLNSFTFRRPTDVQGFPYLSESLPVHPDTITVRAGNLALKSINKTFCFELFPSSAQSLQTWLADKTKSLKTVAELPDSFLGRYDAYPHPFTETHKRNDNEKDGIFRFLGECVPILQDPIDWAHGNVSLEIDESKTAIDIQQWKYIETKDSIHIDCDIFVCGFFDDSEDGIEFHYEIRFLGFDEQQADNEKLAHKFRAKWNTYPEINGAEDFIAKDPFGLNGFYRIKWSLCYI